MKRRALIIKKRSHKKDENAFKKEEKITFMSQHSNSGEEINEKWGLLKVVKYLFKRSKESTVSEKEFPLLLL